MLVMERDNRNNDMIAAGSDETNKNTGEKEAEERKCHMSSENSFDVYI